MKYLSLSQQWVLFGLALFIFGLLYVRFYYHPLRPPETMVREFVVEVSGEVRNPGVYLFEKPPTLGEAIEKAGGLKETARMDIAQTSEILETGTLLTIAKDSPEIPPSPPLLKEGHAGIKRDEIKIRIGRMAANKLLVFSIPLDLNQVSAEDLCLIPGIGMSLAQEIIAYREKRRAFGSVEELKKVKGIGERKWKAIKDFFIVTPAIMVDSS
jgi:competence protein ComEA